MRSQRRITACLVCLALVSAQVCAEETSAALSQQIVKTTQALMDGIGNGDKALWQRTLTDDALIVDEFGRMQSKQEMVNSLRPFPAGFSGSIQIRQPRLRQYGDTVVLQAEGYEQETVFGQQFVVRYINLMTYVKRDGDWKLAGYEAVTLPTPPPRLDVAALKPDDYAGVYRYALDRAWTVSVKNGIVGYVTKEGRPFIPLDPVAKDVFMGTDDERNLLVFRRDAQGHVVELIERRKFNDLRLHRDS
jgi:Domain of unknown function (DUF4440)